MSIWSSIGRLDDGVRAYVVDYHAVGEPTGYVDVATTARDFNECVRLSVNEGDKPFSTQVMLDVENAERLILNLQTAVGYIKRPHA